jgi:Ulp1 family protease
VILQVINFWFQLLGDRDEQLVKDGVLTKRSHFFNSFFYSKVSEGGYNFINVRRWTRKVRRVVERYCLCVAFGLTDANILRCSVTTD